MSNEFNGVLGTQTAANKNVIDPTHPPLVDAIELLGSQGTLAKGQVISLDADGKGVAYTEALDDVAGILTEAVDTTVNTIGPVMVHGVYVLANCLALGAVPTAAIISKLKAKLIFPS